MNIFHFVVIGWLIFFIVGAVCAIKGRNDKPDTSYRNETIIRTCPYCGHEVKAFYFPKTDTRYPQMFKCGECYRLFGDYNGMTEAEKRQVREADAECAQVEKIPELDGIKKVAEDYFLRRYREKWMKSDFLMIKGGKVYRVYIDSTGKIVNDVLFRYTPSKSKIGDQHLCVLCMRHLQNVDRYAWTYSLGDNAVGAERKH